MIREKFERLKAILHGYGSCIVAYSGGVDSVFLAAVSHQVLGTKSLAAIADSASLPRRELHLALEIANEFDFPVRVLKTQEFQNPEYLENPTNRCYFCKHELFTELVPIAKAEGFAVIIYGENASDIGDHRPGSKAAAEFSIRAPLKEADLTKEEIRILSKELGLPTADKPQMACLSSRIPYGEPVSEVKLRMIEEGENLLRDLGFYDVRVRHHETKQGHLARIEIGIAELPKMFIGAHFEPVATGFKSIGYAHCTVDLAGYRRGSLNAKVVKDSGLGTTSHAITTEL